MKRQDGKLRLFSFTLRDLFRGDIYSCTGALHLLRRSTSGDGRLRYLFSRCCSSRASQTGYLFGTLSAAFLSVIGINYIFTFPYWEFNHK